LAIDGPAGAGKSTVAKILAKKLGYTYIDTGAMYRATTYKALRLKVDLDNPEAFDFLDSTQMIFRDGILIMDGEDVSEKIRTHAVSNNVSVVASHIPVRNKLVAIQQKIAQTHDVVMDGRDIGTVVLPHADLKIYMTASVEERARRRHEENLANGIESDYHKILKDIERRDKIDSSRAYNPLRQAEDAVFLDTSHLDIDQVSEQNTNNLFGSSTRKGANRKWMKSRI
jgi:cytidylate kinase